MRIYTFANHVIVISLTVMVVGDGPDEVSQMTTYHFARMCFSLKLGENNKAEWARQPV